MERRTFTNAPINHEKLLRERLRYHSHKVESAAREFSELLKDAIQNNIWLRLTDVSGQMFPNFKTFLGMPEPYGLGMSEEKLFFIAALGGIEKDVTVLLEEEWAANEGGVYTNATIKPGKLIADDGGTK